MSYTDIKIGNEPFINNTVASGYFGDTTGAAKKYSNSNWNAIGPCNLKHSGGIASTSNNALKLISPGIYRLNLSVDVVKVAGKGDNNTISFAFGTGDNSNNPDPSTANFIGQTYVDGNDNGECLANKGLYSTGDVQFISWLTNAWSSGNGSISNYSSDGGSNPPWFNYDSKVNNSYYTYPGLCSTELVFTSRISNQSLYFNLSTNQSDFTIGQCYFVLQMLSTQLP